MLHIFIYYRYENYKPAGVSDQCYTDVVHTIRSFYIGKQWAIESKLVLLERSESKSDGKFGFSNWANQWLLTAYCNFHMMTRACDIETQHLL